MYSENAPLKRPDEYGVYLWWPHKGTQWIHPHDVPKAEEFVPGSRVLRRSDLDRTYSLLAYGDLTFRVRPAMWQPVDYEGYDIGDLIEVKSNFGIREPFIAEIEEMLWNLNTKRIEYMVRRGGRNTLRSYLSEEIQFAERIELLTPEDSDFRYPVHEGTTCFDDLPPLKCW